MSAAATAVCPFCQHEATAPAQLSGLQAQCPRCSNFYTFTPVEPTAGFSASETVDDSRRLVLRIARRRVMYIQCPNCECDLRLNHTKWIRLRKAHLARLKRKKRKALLKKVLAQRSATADSPPAEFPPAMVEMTVPTTEQSPNHVVGPVPVAAGPDEPSRVPPRRRTSADTEHRRTFLALEWLVPLIMLLVSGAIFCTPFSLLAPLVMPLAAAGFLSGLVIFVVAVQRHQFLVRSTATFAYGVIVLLLVTFAPGYFGGNYQAFRQRLSSTDVVQVIPKRGQPATNIPKDTDWVDAGRYALERNRVTVEILAVTVGKTEVRDPGGKMRMSSEPYLVLSLRRRRVGDGEEFAAGVQGRPDVRDTELKLTLIDDKGREYSRQDIDLGWNNSGLARGSTVFPVSTTDDVIAFAPPPADVESLRLEVSSPQLGSGPLRFTIPKSMIVRQPR